MSDLTKARDHARAMQRHQQHCKRTKRLNEPDYDGDWWLSCTRDDPHEEHDWTGDWMGAFDWTCPGICGGCTPERDRELWRRLADELDAHLARNNEETLL